MQICFYFPSLKNSQNNSQFRGMYTSFLNGIEKQGVKTLLTSELNQIEGDILVLIIGGGYEPIAARAMHKFKGPVIFYVHHTYICFYKSFLKRWQSRILFTYSTDFANLSFDKYASVGVKYYHFPFASDPLQFYPVNIEKKYDIAFLGHASSGQGRYRYIEPLIAYVKKNNLDILLAGSGWEKYGYPFQIISHGKLLNIVYNMSKICINIHNDRQYLGMNYEMDANNRVFDLALAGCCQVSNGENMIIKYYDKDEVITADDPEEWIKKIDYYLNHPEERDRVGKKALERSLKEHTWDVRGKEFVNIIQNSLFQYDEKNQNIGIITLWLRYLDQYMLPPYRIKEIRIIRFILKKLKLYQAK
jgi:glycosyltransferase involved in cell wall biosynthesis